MLRKCNINFGDVVRKHFFRSLCLVKPKTHLVAEAREMLQVYFSMYEVLVLVASGVL